MRRTSILIAAASFAACTPDPPPVVAPQPTATPIAVDAPPAGPDVSPVAEPADVIGVVRMRSPGALWNNLASCAGVPARTADGAARDAIEAVLKNAFHEAHESAKDLASLVSLEAPADMVIALEQGSKKFRAMTAFSVGLTSFDRARAAFEGKIPLTEASPGFYRIGGGEMARGPHCALAASAGSAPARIVCGARDKDLLALGPYLARTVPTLPPPSTDVHAELRYKPIDARFGAEWRRLLNLLPTGAQGLTINESRYDTALLDAANALVDEGQALMSDLDQVSLDVSTSPSSCLKAELSLSLRGSASWLAGTLMDRPGRQGAPPAIYWRAPKDSEVAYYTRGSDPMRYSKILTALRDLAAGELAKRKIGSEADQRAAADLLRATTGKDANMVVARGHNPPLPEPKGKASADQKAAEEVLNGYVGWYLIGVDEGPDAHVKMLKDLVAVYNRRPLFDALKKEMRRDGEYLPQAKLVAAPAKLGKGALAVELKFEIKPKKRFDDDGGKAKKQDPIRLTAHVLLMSDGGATWIGVGSNRDELVKRLLSVKSGAPESGTLAARSGLDPLKNGKAMSSGFLSLGLLSSSIPSLLAVPRAANKPIPQDMNELVNALMSMPNKGETPIFLATTAAPGAAPKATFALDVQQGSVVDLGHMIQTGLKIANRSGGFQPPVVPPPPPMPVAPPPPPPNP